MMPLQYSVLTHSALAPGSRYQPPAFRQTRRVTTLDIGAGLIRNRHPGCIGSMGRTASEVGGPIMPGNSRVRIPSDPYVTWSSCRPIACRMEMKPRQ